MSNYILTGRNKKLLGRDKTLTSCQGEIWPPCQDDSCSILTGDNRAYPINRIPSKVKVLLSGTYYYLSIIGSLGSQTATYKSQCNDKRFTLIKSCSATELIIYQNIAGVWTLVFYGSSVTAVITNTIAEYSSTYPSANYYTNICTASNPTIPGCWDKTSDNWVRSTPTGWLLVTTGSIVGAGGISFSDAYARKTITSSNTWNFSDSRVASNWLRFPMSDTQTMTITDKNYTYQGNRATVWNRGLVDDDGETVQLFETNATDWYFAERNIAATNYMMVPAGRIVNNYTDNCQVGLKLDLQIVNNVWTLNVDTVGCNETLSLSYSHNVAPVTTTGFVWRVQNLNGDVLDEWVNSGTTVGTTLNMELTPIY